MPAKMATINRRLPWQIPAVIITLVLLCFIITLFRLGTCVYSQKHYDVSSDASGFNVSVGGIPHTLLSPVFYVGKGQLSMREFRGNFFISNYIQDRIELPEFNITATKTTDTITLTYGTYKIRMTLESTESHPLVVSFSNIGAANVNDAWLRIKAEPTEMVYGLGEQYSYLNLRGRTYPIWTREQGVGRNKSDLVTFYADKLMAGGDYHTTYFPQPTFVSSRKFYCLYKGSTYTEFNFQSPNFHEIYISGEMNQFYFNTDASIKGLVQKMTSYLGRQPELPDWIYSGAILGVQGGTTTMMSRYNHSLQNNVPVSALWIQDWAGELKTSFGSRLFWNWVWDPQRYPGLDNTIKTLRDQNVRVLAYINPNLNSKGKIFQEGAPKGYFIKNSTGQPYLTDFGEFYAATVDLTNPDAYNWYKGKIQVNMIDLGISGWMADFGEYLPADGTFFYNNQSGRVLHNQWPVLWAKLNREAIEERNKTGDVVFWMRAGFTGTGNYTTLMWAGDQNVDFSYGDGLPSTIPAALNMGLSGIGISHFDIGGYTTYQAFGLVRNAELLLRSAEAAVFTPMFRSHEGNQPSANVQFYSNDYVEQQFGRLASIFVSISNYTKSLVRENAETGTPVQRPLFMEFESDVTSWKISYQYMFGPAVLVAPVIATNVKTQNVYLPPGTWKFLWNNRTYTGSTFITVPSPLGKPPVFYKSSSSYADMFSRIQTDFPLIPPPGPPPKSSSTPGKHSTTPSFSCPTSGPVGKAQTLTYNILMFYLVIVASICCQFY